MTQKIVHIRKNLISWYSSHQRELPWRKTKDPYCIWVSEIILQQTQVKTGLDYYIRFIKKFPDVKTLADSEQDEVLKLWQGLGYYSRARNMHFAAKQVMNDFDGVFPSTYEGILSLKGIGEYTAAAISSIAFDLPNAVVDGNVIRVISRLFGISDAVDVAPTLKQIKVLADDLLDANEPGDFNQSMMEYGALKCVPSKPDCENCVLKSWCGAFEQKLVHEIPFKSKKVKVRPRYFHYLLLEDEDGVWMHQRTAGDIWQGLYEFPLLESEKPLSDRSLKNQILEILGLKMNDELSLTLVSKPIKHVLSHQIINGAFYKINSDCMFKPNPKWIKVPWAKVEDYPVARITHRFLEQRGS